MSLYFEIWEGAIVFLKGLYYNTLRENSFLHTESPHPVTFPKKEIS
jgi:hypothetical protein